MRLPLHIIIAATLGGACGNISDSRDYITSATPMPNINTEDQIIKGLCEMVGYKGNTSTLIGSEITGTEAECQERFNAFENPNQMRINCDNNPSIQMFELHYEGESIRNYRC